MDPAEQRVDADGLLTSRAHAPPGLETSLGRIGFQPIVSLHATLSRSERVWPSLRFRLRSSFREASPAHTLTTNPGAPWWGLLRVSFRIQTVFSSVARTLGANCVRSACSKFAHNSRLPEASLQWAFPDRRSEIPKHPLGRRTPLFCFFGLVQRRMGGGKCS
jgi:hypothetical protein